MRRAFLLLMWTFSLAGSSSPCQMLHAARTSPGDLEVGGDLKGLPQGSTRYIRYTDLLRLPQETYSVRDDSNFKGTVRISGISLDQLGHLVGAPQDSDRMVVAICYDQYRTNYPTDYVAAHHPLLVLRIDGHPQGQWPVSEHGGSLGPYVISHPFFRPAFRILSHDDEPQIPYGVTRVEFRRESVVFGAIRPRGEWPAGSAVAQGYGIARQDCFRCHNQGAQGGTMAGTSWLRLASDADANPASFRQIIRDPASQNPHAKMPAHPDYDDATLSALAAYFRTFATPGGAR
jgi:hypothetical protein